MIETMFGGIFALKAFYCGRYPFDLLNEGHSFERGLLVQLRCQCRDCGNKKKIAIVLAKHVQGLIFLIV